MDVPEPRTVIFSGTWAMLRILKLLSNLGQTADEKLAAD
jgi:hypothetical protein